MKRFGWWIDDHLIGLSIITNVVAAVASLTVIALTIL